MIESQILIFDCNKPFWIDRLNNCLAKEVLDAMVCFVLDNLGFVLSNLASRTVASFGSTVAGYAPGFVGIT
jgi:hypothetical protein